MLFLKIIEIIGLLIVLPRPKLYTHLNFTSDFAFYCHLNLSYFYNNLLDISDFFSHFRPNISPLEGLKLACKQPSANIYQPK